MVELHRIRQNVANLYRLVERGIPVVTFSPSACMALKNDYLDVYDTPESREVSANVYDLHEYLSLLNQRGALHRDKMVPVDRRCTIHMHCHGKVQKLDPYVIGMLSLIPSLKFEVLERGSCGVGGSYSFIKGNLKPSLRMGAALFDSVNASSVPVYSTGESCALQMTQGSGVHLGLTSELLAEAFAV
jgi:Fe-S oxidoreductase